MRQQAAPAGELTFERELGRLRGELPGPTLLVAAGVHGNELAGAFAARRVFARLAAQNTITCGEVIVLAGNLASMRAKRRFAVKDLNRQWTPAKVHGLLSRDPFEDDAEDREQRELLVHIDRAIAASRGPLFFLDLHTTSAPGFPFAIHSGDPQQHEFARHFPLPRILGMVERLEGVLSRYMESRGAAALAVEGGRHTDPATVDHLEAALWCGLAASGIATERALTMLLPARTHLTRVRGGLPKVTEVLARYAIAKRDHFVMQPGFANLARVERGRLLASDASGAIRAPSDGMLLLPLYQGQGDDGFFWGREVLRT